MQFVAIRAGGIGKDGDVRLGFADGRVNHGFSDRNTVDQLGDAQALGFFGEVDRLAILELEQVALDDVLAVGAGVQDATALEFDFVQAGQRAGADGFDRRVELEGFEALADGFVSRIIGDGESAEQRNGCSGENLGQTHGNS